MLYEVITPLRLERRGVRPGDVPVADIEAESRVEVDTLRRLEADVHERRIDGSDEVKRRVRRRTAALQAGAKRTGQIGSYNFV